MPCPWQRSFKLTICKAADVQKAQEGSYSFIWSLIITPGKYVQTEASLSSWKSPISATWFWKYWVVPNSLCFLFFFFFVFSASGVND